MARRTDVPDLESLRLMKTEIQRLAAEQRAFNIRVFGSVAKGEATSNSDVDLIVDLDPDLGGFEAFDRLDRLERALARLLRRPVHVVTAGHDSSFANRIRRDAQLL